MATLEPPKKKRATRPSKIPLCAACGRKLRPMKRDSNNNHALAARSARSSRPRLTAEQHHALFHPNNYNTLVLTGDGMPPTRGGDGNNMVCHKDCGHILLMRLLTTLGTDVLAHLPDCWRFRSS